MGIPVRAWRLPGGALRRTFVARWFCRRESVVPVVLVLEGAVPAVRKCVAGDERSWKCELAAPSTSVEDGAEWNVEGARATACRLWFRAAAPGCEHGTLSSRLFVGGAAQAFVQLMCRESLPVAEDRAATSWYGASWRQPNKAVEADGLASGEVLHRCLVSLRARQRWFQVYRPTRTAGPAA